MQAGNYPILKFDGTPSRSDHDKTECISVVICHYNRFTYLEAMAATLCGVHAPVCELLIIDNASTQSDGGVYGRLMSGCLPFPVRVLVNSSNVGAAESRNRGIHDATGTHILFIDSDVSFVSDTVERLWEGRHDVDITFPYAEFEDGMVMNPNNSFERDRVICAVMFLIRKDSLRCMDELFDGDMFIYGEDVDFFMRAHALGLTTRYVEQARIVHPICTKGSAQSYYYGCRNTVYIACKFFGLIRYRMPYPVFVGTHMMRFLYSAITRQYLAGIKLTPFKYEATRWQLICLFIHALVWNIKNAPRILTKRSRLKQYLRKARMIIS